MPTSPPYPVCTHVGPVAGTDPARLFIVGAGPGSETKQPDEPKVVEHVQQDRAPEPVGLAEITE